MSKLINVFLESEKLNSYNFAKWKQLMKDTLVFNELCTVVDKIESRPNNTKAKKQKEYDVRDSKALALTRNSCTQKMLNRPVPYGTRTMH
jgi:hypothetical protein